MKETVLEVVSKDTKTYTIRLTENKVAVPINGWNLLFTVKNNFNDLDADAVISKTVLMPDNANSTNGIGYLSLTSDDTDLEVKEFFFDMKLENPGLTRITFARGKFVILPSIRS